MKGELNHSQILVLYIGTRNMGTLLCISTDGFQTQG